MKIKLICAAVAAVIAASITIAAVAADNSAKNDNDTPAAVSEQTDEELEPGSYFYDGLGNKHILEEGQAPGITRDKDGNIIDQYFGVDPLETATPEELEKLAPAAEEQKEPVGDAELAVVAADAVSFVNSSVHYTGEFGLDKVPKVSRDDDNAYIGVEADSETSLGYMREFFGCDGLLVDEKYTDSLICRVGAGCFNVETEKGAEVKSPVDGKVICVSLGHYNGGKGNTMAVQFGDKIFMLGHLESVDVKVGDEVKAGQKLGVCGDTGMVEVGKTELCFFLMTN